MYFGKKNYLKSSRNHTDKHALNEFLAGLLTMKKAPRHRIYGLWVWLLHRQDRIQISPSIGGLVEVHSKPPALYMPFRSFFLQ